MASQAHLGHLDPQDHKVWTQALLDFEDNGDSFVNLRLQMESVCKLSASVVPMVCATPHQC